MKYHIIICAILKDETPYLVEWVEHHLNLGIEHFVLYDNNSAIPAKQTLAAYIKKGVVEVVDCKITNAPQLKAYAHCLYNMHDRTDWLSFIDIDEFIVLKKHHDIHRFLDDYRDCAGVCLNWMVYTANNHIKTPEGSVMQNYTESMPDDFPVNAHVKSIMQPKHVSAVENPHYPWYNSGYYAVNERYAYVPRSHSRFSNEFAQINHYFTKSYEEWLGKIERGVPDSIRVRDADEFWSYNPGMLHLKDDVVRMYQQIIENNARLQMKEQLLYRCLLC